MQQEEVQLGAIILLVHFNLTRALKVAPGEHHSVEEGLDIIVNRCFLSVRDNVLELPELINDEDFAACDVLNVNLVAWEEAKRFS